MRQSRLPATADDRQCDRPKLSITISSAFNLVFSEWGRIFKDPMTTAAAIDRLVHHSVILEFDVPSFRTETAARSRSRKSTEEPETEETKT